MIRQGGFITKARNDENTKAKNNFVLSNFRVFVINPFWFPDKRDLRFAPTPGAGSTLRYDRLVRVRF
jgi:hypothetical protein